MAVSCFFLAGDAPRGVPLANEALALARQIGAPALIATALIEAGAAVVQTNPEQARAYLREARTQHGAWPQSARPRLGDRARVVPPRPDRHPRARTQCHSCPTTGR